LIILSGRAVFFVVEQAEVQDMVVAANQGRAATAEVGIFLAAHRDLVVALLVFRECMGMSWLETVSPVVVEVEAKPSPEKNQEGKPWEECFLVVSQERKKQFSQKGWKQKQLCRNWDSFVLQVEVLCHTSYIAWVISPDKYTFHLRFQ
jgi:hypothetical protein